MTTGPLSNRVRLTLRGEAEEKMTARLSTPDFVAGAFVLSVGLFFLVSGWTLPVGDTQNMGPGYFPRLVSGMVTILGTIITIRSFWIGPKSFPPVPVRQILGITAAIMLFMLALNWLGLAAAVFLCAFVGATTYEKFSILEAVLVATALSVAASVLFVVVLDIPFEIFPA